jgi:hypothetical protein
MQFDANELWTTADVITISAISELADYVDQSVCLIPAISVNGSLCSQVQFVPLLEKAPSQ